MKSVNPKRIGSKQVLISDYFNYPLSMVFGDILAVPNVRQINPASYTIRYQYKGIPVGSLNDSQQININDRDNEDIREHFNKLLDDLKRCSGSQIDNTAIDELYKYFSSEEFICSARFLLINDGTTYFITDWIYDAPDSMEQKFIPYSDSLRDSSPKADVARGNARKRTEGGISEFTRESQQTNSASRQRTTKSLAGINVHERKTLGLWIAFLALLIIATLLWGLLKRKPRGPEDNLARNDSPHEVVERTDGNQHKGDDGSPKTEIDGRRPIGSGRKSDSGGKQSGGEGKSGVPVSKQPASSDKGATKAGGSGQGDNNAQETSQKAPNADAQKPSGRHGKDSDGADPSKSADGDPESAGGSDSQSPASTTPSQPQSVDGDGPKEQRQQGSAGDKRLGDGGQSKQDGAKSPISAEQRTTKEGIPVTGTKKDNAASQQAPITSGQDPSHKSGGSSAGDNPPQKETRDPKSSGENDGQDPAGNSRNQPEPTSGSGLKGQAEGDVDVKQPEGGGESGGPSGEKVPVDADQGKPEGDDPDVGEKKDQAASQQNPKTPSQETSSIADRDSTGANQSKPELEGARSSIGSDGQIPPVKFPDQPDAGSEYPESSGKSGDESPISAEKGNAKEEEPGVGDKKDQLASQQDSLASREKLSGKLGGDTSGADPSKNQPSSESGDSGNKTNSDQPVKPIGNVRSPDKADSMKVYTFGNVPIPKGIPLPLTYEWKPRGEYNTKDFSGSFHLAQPPVLKDPINETVVIEFKCIISGANGKRVGEFDVKIEYPKTVAKGEGE